LPRQMVPNRVRRRPRLGKSRISDQRIVNLFSCSGHTSTTTQARHRKAIRQTSGQTAKLWCDRAGSSSNRPRVAAQVAGVPASAPLTATFSFVPVSGIRAAAFSPSWTFGTRGGARPSAAMTIPRYSKPDLRYIARKPRRFPTIIDRRGFSGALMFASNRRGDRRAARCDRDVIFQEAWTRVPSIEVVSRKCAAMEVGAGEGNLKS